MPDALPQQADGALGPPEPLTDLPGGVPLQAQFQDRAFLLVQAGKELPDRFAQDGRFERRRLASVVFPPHGPPARRREFFLPIPGAAQIYFVEAR